MNVLFAISSNAHDYILIASLTTCLDTIEQRIRGPTISFPFISIQHNQQILALYSIVSSIDYCELLARFSPDSYVGLTRVDTSPFFNMGPEMFPAQTYYSLSKLPKNYNF